MGIFGQLFVAFLENLDPTTGFNSLPSAGLKLVKLLRLSKK